MRISLSLLALIAATVAIPAAGRTPDTPDVQLQKLLAGREPGKPLDCISLFGSPSSQIIGGKAIVYRSGGTLYVNEPSGADMLRSDDILVTRTFGSRLCRVDSVRLLDRSSRFQRGFVILGDFVPYRKPKSAG